MLNFRPPKLLLAALLWQFSCPVWPAEYQELEDIAPESAEDSPVALSGLGRPSDRPRRRVLRDALAERLPFWRDSSLELNLRLYDFNRENGEDTLSEALALGTELTHRSGEWRQSLSTVLSWHTSNKIDAPEEYPLSGILGPDQSDISVISRAYLDLHLAEQTTLRLYRQDFDLPYLNRNDNRMIPNTHEAYVLQRTGGRIRYLVGHVTKMKAKDSEEFVPLGKIAGVEESDDGMTTAVIGYRYSEESRLAAQVQYLPELYNTTYLEATHHRTLSGDWASQWGAQLTNQWSVGDELLGEFNSYSWGLRGRFSYRGSMFTAAFIRNGEAEIRNPFGGTPGFTGGMIAEFDRAEEESYRIGLSHNFARLGYPGIGLIVNYTSGRNAVSEQGVSLEDTEELAITADFRPERGRLKGLWLRLRYADLDRGSALADRRDIRVIVNYSLDAL